MWEEISDWEPAKQRDALLELVPAIIDKYADTSSAAAAEWYERVRGKWISDDFKAQTPVRANDDTSNLIRAKAGVLFGDDADPMQMLRFLNGVVDKGVKQGGRDAIRYNARRDPKKPRYARVPSGAKTCAFCMMLASRGFVYASKEKAGGDGNRFHGDCDCQIVPSWDSDNPRIAGYDPDALYDKYLNARKAAGENPSKSDILTSMRRMYPDDLKDGVRELTKAWPDDVVYPYAESWDHIFEGHGPGTRVEGKTHFPDDWDEEKVKWAVMETVADPDCVKPAGENRQTRYKIVEDELIRVWLQKKRGKEKRFRIHTGHPTTIQERERLWHLIGSYQQPTDG